MSESTTSTITADNSTAQGDSVPAVEAVPTATAHSEFGEMQLTPRSSAYATSVRFADPTEPIQYEVAFPRVDLIESILGPKPEDLYPPVVFAFNVDSRGWNDALVNDPARYGDYPTSEDEAVAWTKRFIEDDGIPA